MTIRQFISAMLISICLTGSVVAQSASDLYKKCQGCHGVEGRATMIGKKLGAKDFQDPGVLKISATGLEEIIRDGKNKMPSYKGKLTDEQIAALAKYIKEMK